MTFLVNACFSSLCSIISFSFSRTTVVASIPDFFVEFGMFELSNKTLAATYSPACTLFTLKLACVFDIISDFPLYGPCPHTLISDLFAGM